MVWASIEDKTNPGIKIKNYDKFRFNFDIDLPLYTIIEFRSLSINIICVIEKDNEYYPEIYLDECSYVKDNPCLTQHCSLKVYFLQKKFSQKNIIKLKFSSKDL